jgi:hypothetical protein
MAISHIPAHVGHNFVPEYQISAVPKAINISTSSRIVVRKVDGLIVGKVLTTDADSDVTTFPTSSGVADLAIFSDGGDGVIQQDEKKANNLNNTFVIIRVLKLPKVSQWIQVRSPNAASVSLAFSRKGAANGSVIVVNPDTDSYPLRLRCVNIYLLDTVTTGIILAGLTVIERKEFDNIVEKFSGDDITVSV